MKPIDLSLVIWDKLGISSSFNKVISLFNGDFGNEEIMKVVVGNIFLLIIAIICATFIISFGRKNKEKNIVKALYANNDLSRFGDEIFNMKYTYPKGLTHNALLYLIIIIICIVFDMIVLNNTFWGSKWFGYVVLFILMGGYILGDTDIGVYAYVGVLSIIGWLIIHGTYWLFDDIADLRNCWRYLCVFLSFIVTYIIINKFRETTPNGFRKQFRQLNYDLINSNNEDTKNYIKFKLYILIYLLYNSSEAKLYIYQYLYSTAKTNQNASYYYNLCNIISKEIDKEEQAENLRENLKVSREARESRNREDNQKSYKVKHYDKWGYLIGETKIDPKNNKMNYYDKWGWKTGESEIDKKQ